MDRWNTVSKPLIAGFLAMAMTMPAFANKAGRVSFAIGEVTAINAAGDARRLMRGAALFSGDTINTGKGRAQLKFTDGGRISLSPKSEFKIEEYRFNGKQDGTERGFFSFLKGGLRALTGLVGKRNRSNYRVRTPVATIGIRGTWFTARFVDGRLLVSVGYDPNDATSVVVSNSAGELVVPRGGNAQVTDENTPPEPTDVQVSIAPAPPPTSEEPVFVAGDQRDEDGSQSVVEDTLTVATNLIGAVAWAEEPEYFEEDHHEVGAQITIVLDGDVPVIGMGQDAGIEEFPNPHPGVVTLSPSLVTGLPDAMQAIIDQVPASAFAALAEGPAEVADYNTSDGLSWWRWTNGRVLEVDSEPVAGRYTAEIHDLTGNQSSHFIVGPPPTSMPNTGTGTYDFVGGTASSTDSGAGATGQGITAGTLMASFSTSAIGVYLTVNHGGSYTVSGSAHIQDNFFTDFQAGDGAGSVHASGSQGTNCYVSNCGASIRGFFSGSNSSGMPPPAAGLTVRIEEADPIMAAGAFKLVEGGYGY